MELAKTLSVSSLKVRYFAFNALEIKMPDGKTLVVDPCLEKEGHFSCGYDVDDLEGCDYVFLNHSHGDHAASLGKLYDKYHPLIMAHAVTSFNLARLYDIPYIRFIPFVNGDEYDFDSFKIQVVPGRHNNLVPGNFMVRPSGRRDELCGTRVMNMKHGSELEKELGDMGTMYGSNFLLTTANNLRVGFYAGNAGMEDPQEKNLWTRLRPDVIFAHRAKFTTGNLSASQSVQKMADVLEITGARILIPIHIEDAYSGKYDPTEYVYQVNKACEERNILGRMMFMERGQWYQFSTMVSIL